MAFARIDGREGKEPLAKKKEASGGPEIIIYRAHMKVGYAIE